MKRNEYYSLSNKKIEKIENEHKEIAEKVDSLKCDKAHKKLLKVFLSNLKESKVNEDLYTKIEQMLDEGYNIEKIMEGHECLFGISSEDREICTFDDMMKACKEKSGTDFIEDSLRYVINQHENDKENGNMIDNFLNYIIANNYDDITHGIWEDANWADAYYESSIYGYPVGRIFIEKLSMKDGKEFFSPESLHVRKNMQGLRIGASLLKKVMSDMYEKHPGEPLVSPTVMMSNVNALKLYTNLGADVYVDGQKVDDPINGMDHSRPDNCLVVFSPDEIKKDSEMVIEKPTQKINKIINFKEGYEK